MQKAFTGPLEILRRTGTLNAAKLAAIEPGGVRRPLPPAPGDPSIPGFDGRQGPGPLAAVVVRDYGGDAPRIWTEATDARDLEKRLLGLPGIGPMKAKTLLAILGKQLGVKPAGWDEVAPTTTTRGCRLARRRSLSLPGRQARLQGSAAGPAGAPQRPAPAAMAVDDKG